ncbi:MAG TPA: SET domain-containing protein [candidate division Zixibacteria bacterium]|nr:SET domain-containing protein [candidate division Zixibacteria bacterium]
MNHCCRPNSYVRSIDGVRYLIALRDIAPDDEITFDYYIIGGGDTIWECSCRHLQCRREIHSSFFHLPVELQFEYRPLLDSWFVEENRTKVGQLENYSGSS